jgi:hypothetical protein
MRGPAHLSGAVGQSITRAVDLTFSARWIQTGRVEEDGGWLHFWWRSLVVSDGRRPPYQPCDLLVVLQRSLLVGVSWTLKASGGSPPGGSNPSASAALTSMNVGRGRITWPLVFVLAVAFLETLERVHRQFGGQVRFGLRGPQRGHPWLRQVTAVPLGERPRRG